VHVEAEIGDQNEYSTNQRDDLDKSRTAHQISGKASLKVF
jgi:hypothetical protein